MSTYIFMIQKERNVAVQPIFYRERKYYRAQEIPFILL